MAVTTKATLYTYFATGAKPTAAQFTNLIDSSAAFAKVVAGDATLSATEMSDKLTLTAGSYITISGSGKTVTIACNPPTGYMSTSNPSFSGTLSGPAASFSGNCTAAGFYTGSDKVLKDDIKELNQDLIDAAASVKFHSFKWKADGKADVGVIAQEVKAAGLDMLVAEAYNDADTIVLKVDYIRLLLLKVASLEQEVARLKTAVLEHSK